MRLLMIFALLVVALVATRDAHALQSTIHRCVDAQGHQVFTDRSCADMQATPALPEAAATGAVAPATSLAAPELCASSVQGLRQQIVDAFATHNPNRIAGLTLWSGYSRRSAIESIRSLSALMQQPLLDIDDGPPPALSVSTKPDVYDASEPLDELLAPGQEPAEHTQTRDRLVLVTGADGSGTRETPFALTRQSGCVWLLPMQ